jgi:hypothetical protein
MRKTGDFLRVVVAAGAMLAASSVFAQSITPGATRNAPAPGGFSPPAQAAQTETTPRATNTVTTTQVPGGPKVIKAEGERKGRTGTDIFLGTYLTLSADCKVGPNPTIEFTAAPKNGITKLRTYPINLRDVPGAPKRTCIGTSPRGAAAVYRSNPRFKGEDHLSFVVRYPNGDTREVSMKVTVQ